MANQDHLKALASSADDWNYWRENNRDIIPELNRVDLSTWDLGHRNLWRANLSYSQLNKIRLWRANLWAAYLERADIQYGHLVEAKIERANLNNTNLENADLSRVYAVDAIFDGANLRNANLTEANLNGASLRRADLRGAILNRAQVLGTCFEGADLTGACIEDWNYNHTIKLNNISCDFIYLSANQRDRRPRTGIFKSGEFAKLIEKVQETVELVYNDGINWLAFQLTLQDLLSIYSKDNLSIQSIEEKSERAIVIRLNSSFDADKIAIEEQAKKLYERKLNEFAINKEGMALLLSRKQAEPNNSELQRIIYNNCQFVSASDLSHVQIINQIANKQQNEVAREIITLTEKLLEKYPVGTTTEKMKLATKVVEQIEGDQKFYQRIFAAFKAGGIAALKESYKHPAAIFVINALDELLKAGTKK